mgnify:CR=1 FL=1
MLNPKVVGIVEVTDALTTLEDESGLQIKVQTNNLAHIIKAEVTEDRIAEMLPLNLTVETQSGSDVYIVVS